MKKITDLTKDEGWDILKFVYPDKVNLLEKHKSDYYLTDFSFESIQTENGMHQITLSGRLIIGILYHNGQDRCILHFDHSKVVEWLYKHDYDITEQLEANSEMTDYHEKLEALCSDFAFLIRYEGIFKRRKADNNPPFGEYDFEFLQKKLEILTERYFNL